MDRKKKKNNNGYNGLIQRHISFINSDDSSSEEEKAYEIYNDEINKKIQNDTLTENINYLYNMMTHKQRRILHNGNTILQRHNGKAKN